MVELDSSHLKSTHLFYSVSYAGQLHSLSAFTTLIYFPNELSAGKLNAPLTRYRAVVLIPPQANTSSNQQQQDSDDDVFNMPRTPRRTPMACQFCRGILLLCLAALNHY